MEETILWKVQEVHHLGSPLTEILPEWNGQMRQPIPLVHPRGLVATAPFEGFLHPNTELDTLGFDRPESECRING